MSRTKDVKSMTGYLLETKLAEPIQCVQFFSCLDFESTFLVRNNRGGSHWPSRKQQKNKPVHYCTCIQAFSSPESFHPQALHNEDLKKNIIPCVGVAEELKMISPIPSYNQHIIRFHQILLATQYYSRVYKNYRCLHPLSLTFGIEKLMTNIHIISELYSINEPR